jgi:hypothetical protein
VGFAEWIEFMGKNASLIRVLAAGAVVAGLATVVIGLCSPRLPDPATADREGLLRWLVTQDLSQEPLDTRLTLARRLEQEFGEKIDWAAVGKRLDGPQRDRLWENVALLLEPWFADKVDGYFRLPESGRPAYVDRTIELIDNWKGAVALAADPPAGNPCAKRPGLLELLAERIGRWMQSVTPHRRDEARQFLLAVQTRWLQGALLGSGTAKPL